MKLILIVEDEYGNAEVLRMLLEADGYRVAQATDGKEALERLAGEKPALVLSDFMMPHMNGAELGCAIRADAALCDIPIVIMSGTDEDVVRRSFDDYDGFICKPFAADVLKTVIAPFLERGRAVPVRDPEIDESMRQLLKGIDIPPID